MGIMRTYACRLLPQGPWQRSLQRTWRLCGQSVMWWPPWTAKTPRCSMPSPEVLGLVREMSDIHLWEYRPYVLHSHCKSMSAMKECSQCHP